MRQPIVTLTTDFGLADHFVGAMKGILLSMEPRARIVDLSHEIAPYSIPEAAFVLAQAYGCFPPGTVHVAVVDPGVGTSRRPILAEAAGQYFVAPDNGVLSMIYSREKHKVRHVTAEKFFLKPVSETFHGRDIFAPIAAHLAGGTPPAHFGKVIADYLRLEFDRPTRTGKRIWTGAILKIDHFGNLITNFHVGEFPTVQTRSFVMAVGAERLTRVVRTFADCPIGEVCVIVGSSGYLEVISNRASAAMMLGCAVGAPAELTLY